MYYTAIRAGNYDRKTVKRDENQQKQSNNVVCALDFPRTYLYQNYISMYDIIFSEILRWLQLIVENNAIKQLFIKDLV